MLRNSFIVAAMLVVSSVPASAQENYPVAIGLGGGIQGHVRDYHHGMAVVTVTPPRWPVALRLDGVVGKRGLSSVRALSASAVVTLRPWRLAPYLIVGSSRTTGDYGGSSWASNEWKTELTGGLGLKFRFGSTTLFTEMRSLGAVGTPLTIGFTF